MMKLTILDSTLRDGCQGMKISYTVSDKLKIIDLLDNFGVDYIEVGSPAYSLKDAELFKALSSKKLKHSQIACFGSTRRVGVKAKEDENLKLLAQIDTKAAVIFGKCWDLHVKEVLNATLEENLAMIGESVEFLKSSGKKVIFDAEHFFDGYKANKEYAINAVKAADKAGADTVCLCDTNGGAFPDEIREAVETVKSCVNCTIGIHTHNDGAMAVSNSVFAVYGGASHIQGTMIGTGERCGNANLSAVISNLQLKKGYEIVDDLSELTYTCRAIAEISNISMRDLPYVGKNAFSHKAGTHIDGVLKNPASFEHINPESVGNDRSFLISEAAGKSATYAMIKKIMPDLDK
ncbi:MAG: citramalate synthase, partial [Bacillota bacterium]|nr:citramalate synthase [Bacillota bacterium]